MWDRATPFFMACELGMAQKRKRVVVFTVVILKKIDEVVPQTRLADQYEVGRSTITDL